MIKQRWIHYYFVSEVVHAVILIYLCMRYRHILTVAAVYASIYALNFALVCFVLVVRRAFRDSNRWIASIASLSKGTPTFKVFTHTTRDGVKLKCRISGDVGRGGAKKPVMLLAAPLGQCGPAIYNPILRYFGDEFVYLTWDYRGLFGSTNPSAGRNSVRDSAEDAMEVLTAAGYDSCEVMLGHSMGTAVTLEASLLYPDKIGNMILLNGFHGHVFQTAFQPLVRLPIVGDCIGHLIEKMLAHRSLLEFLRRGLSAWMRFYSPLYGRFFGSSLMRATEGDDYLSKFVDAYLGPLFESPTSLRNYLRLFQELDAHSVYHRLPSIQQRMLLISGFFDMFTPPMQSVEIARRVPHSVHYCDPFSSHASILESPERVVAEIAEFLHGGGLWNVDPSEHGASSKKGD